MTPTLTPSYYLLCDTMDKLEIHALERQALIEERNLNMCRAVAEGTSPTQVRKVVNLTRQQVYNVVRDTSQREMIHHEREDFLAWKTRDMNAEEARAFRAENYPDL
jgi:hypothetical protein